MKSSVHYHVLKYYALEESTSLSLNTNACCTNIEYPNDKKNSMNLRRQPINKYHGRQALYKRTIQNEENTFYLNTHYHVKMDNIIPVCNNTFMMLYSTKWAPHFDLWGAFSTQLGIFEGCGGSASVPFRTKVNSTIEGAICC